MLSTALSSVQAINLARSALPRERFRSLGEDRSRQPMIAAAVHDPKRNRRSGFAVPHISCCLFDLSGFFKNAAGIPSARKLRVGAEQDGTSNRAQVDGNDVTCQPLLRPAPMSR
jgi:hypothetical protein